MLILDSNTISCYFKIYKPTAKFSLARKGAVPRHLAMIAVLIGEMADRGIDYRALLARMDAMESNEKINNTTSGYILKKEDLA